MKSTTKKNNIERNGNFKKRECRISAGAHMFQMLARQYSNPKKAIVQEIGANCLDSHKRAGKENVPFSVTLPGRLDDHIRFRDYGVSMSPEVIEKVYVEYGHSDKQNTNNEVGFFGIGLRPRYTSCSSASAN